MTLYLAMEGGMFKRLYRSYHMDLFTKEKFEMPEPQPLGWNNVLFCFTCLGFGTCISVFMVLIEFIRGKISQ